MQHTTNFNKNNTVNGLEVKLHLKEDAKLIQQKGRPLSIHLKQSVEKEIENRTERTGRPVYKITIKAEGGVHKRVGQRTRDTTTRKKPPGHGGN